MIISYLTVCLNQILYTPAHIVLHVTIKQNECYQTSVVHHLNVHLVPKPFKSESLNFLIRWYWLSTCDHLGNTFLPCLHLGQYILPATILTLAAQLLHVGTKCV